jgi:hypothetical protein
MFHSVETWFVAQVKTEIAVFDKAYFKSVWNNDLITHELQMKKSLIQCYSVFRNLSELAIIALVSEFIQIKKFKKDTLMMPQSVFSPTN